MAILHIEVILFLILILLLIASLMDRRKDDNDKAYMLFLTAQLNVLIFDIIFNSLEKISSYNSIFQICAFCSLLFTYGVLTFFSHSILLRVSKIKKIVSFLVLFCDVSFLINSFFLVLNINSNFIYIIKNGIYEFETFFFLLSLNPMVVVLSLAFVIFFVKDFSISERISVVLFCAFPAVSVYFIYLSRFEQYSTCFLYIADSLSIIIYYITIRERDKKNYFEDEIKLKNQEMALMFSQMKPHFIFNVLTSIEYLYDSDKEQGKKLLNNFNKYLRNNLDLVERQEIISFKKELDNVNVYIEIEKTRFKDRLNIVYDIKEDDFSIPTLIIQPLVENAIKHGICKKIEGGTITIKTYKELDDIIIKIIDDGIGFDTKTIVEDNHYGLKNTIGRFDAFFKHSSLDIDSTIGSGTTITMTIKKEDQL